MRSFLWWNVLKTGSEEYRTLVLTLIKMSVSSAQCMLGAVSRANRKWDSLSSDFIWMFNGRHVSAPSSLYMSSAVHETSRELDISADNPPWRHLPSSCFLPSHCSSLLCLHLHAPLSSIISSTSFSLSLAALSSPPPLLSFTFLHPPLPPLCLCEAADSAGWLNGIKCSISSTSSSISLKWRGGGGYSEDTLVLQHLYT